jgi:hypothetical protein
MIQLIWEEVVCTYVPSINKLGADTCRGHSIDNVWLIGSVSTSRARLLCDQQHMYATGQQPVPTTPGRSGICTSSQVTMSAAVPHSV